MSDRRGSVSVCVVTRCPAAQLTYLFIYTSEQQPTRRPTNQYKLFTTTFYNSYWKNERVNLMTMMMIIIIIIIIEFIQRHMVVHMPIQDHHQAISAAIRKPLPDWRRPVGRPRHTWLRAVESDLRPLNTLTCLQLGGRQLIGRLAISCAYGYAQDEFAIKEEGYSRNTVVVAQSNCSAVV